MNNQTYNTENSIKQNNIACGRSAQWRVKIKAQYNALALYQEEYSKGCSSEELQEATKPMKTAWDLGIIQQAFVCLGIPRWLDQLIGQWDSVRERQWNNVTVREGDLLSLHINLSPEKLSSKVWIP